MAGSKPKGVLRAGTLQAAIWDREFMYQGATKHSFSIKLSKSYKDARGKWQETSILFPSELLIAAELLKETWRALEIKETERTPEEQKVFAEPEVPKTT